MTLIWQICAEMLGVGLRPRSPGLKASRPRLTGWIYNDLVRSSKSGDLRLFCVTGHRPATVWFY